MLSLLYLVDYLGQKEKSMFHKMQFYIGHDAKVEYDNELMTVRLGDFNHDKTALKATLKNG